MKRTKDKIFYDNGFGYRAYICPNCGSRKLVREVQGGFNPPRYTCEDCCIEVNSPVWEDITDEEKKELGIKDELISPHVQMALDKYKQNTQENQRIIEEVIAEFRPKVDKAVQDRDLELLQEYYKILSPLPIDLVIEITEKIVELQFSHS